MLDGGCVRSGYFLLHRHKAGTLSAAGRFAALLIEKGCSNRLMAGCMTG